MSEVTVTFRLNGEETVVVVHPMARLIDVLRHDLHLTGTKEGCGEGECGACAILLDGALVNSCLVPVVQADGAGLVTIEGLAGKDEQLAAIQRAFVAEGGAQCGICTPGMVLAAHVLLERVPEPTDDEIKEALAGSLCRCTGYMRIFEAVRAAARQTTPSDNQGMPPGLSDQGPGPAA